MKRREFVIRGSLATLAMTAPSAVLGGFNLFNGANDTVNLGIIGTGSRGAGLIPLINQIEKLRVVACCDIEPKHLENGIKQSEGKPKGYADYRRLLGNRDIDAVLVAVPFGLHAGIELAAMDAGKHIYGEKTLAKGYGDIKALLQKKSNKTIFQTGHQYHSSRLYTHVVDLIKKGKIGKIAGFECQWNRNGDWRRPVLNPEKERIVNWRLYKKYSGGLTAELSSHQIDFANWVQESTPKQVMGTGGIDYWKDGRETYDNTHLIYSYPDGVEAKFTCLTTNSMNDYQIKVMGSKGTIILDYTKAWFYPEGGYDKKKGNVDGVSGATIPWEQGKGVPIHINHADPSKQALMDFRDSILNNKTPLSNLESGSKTAICVQMGLDAMYNNEIIKWNQSLINSSNAN